MSRQDVLDLEHRDVLRVADDDVLQPAGDPHVSTVIDAAEVAGAEPPFGEEARGVERGVYVADKLLGPTEHEFAFGPCRDVVTRFVDDAHLDASAGTSHRARHHIGRVITSGAGGVGELGETP